jgi:hypothetical protein
MRKTKLKFWQAKSSEASRRPSLSARTYAGRARRTELLSVVQLKKLAHTLALHSDIGGMAGDDELFAELADNEAALKSGYNMLCDALARGRNLTPAADWFIDNYSLIEEQIYNARLHLPKKYSRGLPRLISGVGKGRPRVYDLALELTAHSHGRIDETSLRAFVTAYQSVCTLALCELWAIPIMLRLALLQNLRGVVEHIVAGRIDRERAGYWIDRMLA